MRVKKCLNICCKAWLSKKIHSWHTITTTPTHAIFYLQLTGFLQGFIRVLFTIRICFRQVTTSKMKPHLEQEIFFLLPWALPSGILQCFSSPVTSTAKPLLATTNLQFQFLHIAMGGCQFHVLLVVLWINSGRYTMWSFWRAACKKMFR